MHLSSKDVADILGVRPTILREWVTQYGCPYPIRDAGPRVRFDADEVIALREELLRGHSIVGAIGRVRDTPHHAAAVA